MDLDFKRIFEAAPGLLLLLAPDPPQFTILDASDAYLRAVKKQREELVGLPVFEALPVGPDEGDSRRNSTESFQRAIDTRRPDTMAVQRHDIVRPASEGGGYEPKYWSVINTPVLDADGNVACILHRVEDVTEFVQLRERSAEQQALAEALRSRAGEMEVEIYRRAQEIQAVNRQLRAANEKLGALDRAKTAFFSNVSHEFRTPLTLILGTLEELLRREDLVPAVRTELMVGHRNSLRLLKLVNALLDFSRLEAGRAEPNYRLTDLGTLTAELAASFESACARAGIRLTVDSPPLRTRVPVDREMWEKIVLNLLSNAFKFTEQGEIEVRVREVAHGCELSVRDTGAGIPAEALPHIFERFHRVAATSARSTEGTGIGLSLVRELANLHGGDVQVSSVLGKGTTFTVTLPFRTAKATADTADAGRAAASREAAAFVEEALRWLPSPQTHGEPPDVASPPGAAPAVRPRVLLADDNADMRDHITRLLVPRFEVIAAHDGEEALGLSKREHPDLILADVMMPGLDGFGLLRSVRADPELRATPVILISARAGEESTGEGLEAGADDYLVKPFSARELLARVSANLDLARMRAEIAQAAAREAALKELDQRKDAFLAMLSHELRNPIAPISNSVYILENAAPGGAQAKQALRIIIRQVTHLSRMVEDLLDVSRITQGKMRIEAERIELTQLVRELVEDARKEFDRAGIDFHADIDGRPMWLNGDRTRLGQVVCNLLRNAAKFTEGGGHVVLSLRAENTDTALLTVRDDGVGIPPEVLPHIFEPFVQADHSIDRSLGGLGLGLAIVKGLVDAHGGSVSARSGRRGAGAEFVVRLPLRQRMSPRDDPETAAASVLQPRRVLIIEDNSDAADTLKAVLELNGHVVEVASDGEAGLERARAWQPDVIVSDIGMPRLDGYGVAKAVREDRTLHTVCLVAITGYAALDDVQRSKDAGFDYHMSKPPDVRALAEILADCADRTTPRQE